MLESDIHIYHQEGSKEIFDGHENQSEEPRLKAHLDGAFDLDVANGVHVAIERMPVPPIIVQLSQREITAFEEAAAGRDWKMVVEVMFA